MSKAKADEAPAAGSPQFTPGPWGTDFDHPSRYTRIRASANRFIIAMVGNNEYGNARNAANATLIAAAPDLYEALRRLIAWDEGACITAPPQEPWKSVIDAAHAALAKAEGRSAGGARPPKDPQP